MAGPIGFVGLMIPPLARWLMGNDLRWALPCCMLLAPILLLLADILGRLLLPGELRVSIVTAFVGAPLLIWLARRS
ncbi:Ferric enterobactin transport system permease protein FepD [compost metagenome]